ncbi:MAG: A/G-specific adenine glycosylase [Opitutales bacterium]
MNLTNDTTAFQKALADWYADAQRPLPWRTEPGLYRTVVSELMAQQTQIKTMLPYFEKWMQRFPDFETLAAASPDNVLKHWEGLGYYSRARNLHKLAKEYISMDPKPRTRKEWQNLPGIGPYTSAAIASIALGEPTAVVDGNVVRILARLTGDDRRFKSNSDAVKFFSDLADKVLAVRNPGDHNQAMMELGATVCLKHKPACTTCPVVDFCQGHRERIQDAIPRIERRSTIKEEIRRAWVVMDGAILLQRIANESGQLAGQFELPLLETIESKIRPKLITTKSRSITHRRIKEFIYEAKVAPGEHASLIWVSIEQLDTITLSGPHRRWIGDLLKDQPNN